MPEVLQQMLNYVIAIYIRLSAEDGDLSDEKNESNSVVNQRAYIRRFIELRPEFAGAASRTGTPEEDQLHHRQGYVSVWPRLYRGWRLSGTDFPFPGRAIYRHQ